MAEVPAYEPWARWRECARSLAELAEDAPEIAKELLR
jgi:hypothetical protein